jgi:hypothetical protein
MDNPSLWTLTREARHELFPSFVPMFDQFASAHQLSERGFGWLFTALTFEPEAVTAAGLQVRTPYTAESTFLAELRSVAGASYFVEQPTGEFHLTPPARAGTIKIIEAGRLAMAAADPLPAGESTRLAELFTGLVQAAQDMPILGNWSLRLSYKLMPPSQPPLPYWEQAVSCLFGYRDDAHIAAWKPGGLDGPTVEALTFLWRGDADSLDSLCAKLAHRGHPRQVYAAGVEELRRQGYLQGPDSSLDLTESGRRFREGIEQETDRLFYAPWSHLADAEKTEMADLLTRLRDGLKSKFSGGK